MNDFFARLYEWFGLISFYSKDLGEHLSGLDYACTGYFALSAYQYVGWIMIIITTCIFALQYDIIDASRFTSRKHWGLAAFTLVAFNFVIAAAAPFIALQTASYCLRLTFSVADCFGFGLSNAIWGFVLFAMLSGIQMIAGLITGSQKVK